MFGPKGGRKDRSLAGRPSPGGLQAPRDLRGPGHSPGGDVDGRQPQRHHRADPAGRSRAADRPLRQVQAEGTARRSCLRQPCSPQRAARAWHHTPNRQTRHWPRLRARQRTLGGGANDLLAYTPTGASSAATTAATTSTKPSSPSAAPSSATNTYKVHFDRHSKPFWAFNRLGMKKNPISSKSEREVRHCLRGGTGRRDTF